MLILALRVLIGTARNLPYLPLATPYRTYTFRTRPLIRTRSCTCLAKDRKKYGYLEYVSKHVVPLS